MEGQVKVRGEDFDKINVLGEGSFGKVFLVYKVKGWDYGHMYALKQVRKTENRKRMDYFLGELQVLKSVREKPFLATLHYAFETSTHLNFVLEYVSGGDLFTHVSRRGSLCESCVKFYVGELVLALRYLHKRIVHRDVKLENILIDSFGHVILTDFGCSSDQIPISDVCGTLRYMAPEAIEPSRYEGHDCAVDWWAVGVVTYELLTGRTPFTSHEDENSYESIVSGILWGTPSYPSTFSKEVRDFIHSLLNKDSRKRLGTRGTKKVMKHHFFKTINWKNLKKKKVPAPYIPRVTSDRDVSNFSEKFTKLRVEEPKDDSHLCPCDPDTLSCLIHTSHKLLEDFYYVAPAMQQSPTKWTEPPSPHASPCRSALCGSRLSAARSALGSQGFSITRCGEPDMGLDVSPIQVRKPGARKRVRSGRHFVRPFPDLTEVDPTKVYLDMMADDEVSNKRRRLNNSFVHKIISFPSVIY